MGEVASLSAAKEIRRRILNGHFEPGDCLTVLTLAGELGMSRTPVRDALRELEKEGLVIIRPRQGAIVRELTVDEISDLFVFRYTLEPSICLLAATRRLAADLKVLKEVLNRLEKAQRDLERNPDSVALTRRFQELDSEFHLAIAAAAHSEVAQELLNKLQIWQSLCRRALPQHLVVPSNFSNSYEETNLQHEEIFRLIEQRQPRLVREKMSAHLQVLYDAAMTWISPRDNAESGK